MDVTQDTTSFTIPEGATVNVSFTISSYPEVTEPPALKRLDGSPLSVTPVFTADSVTLSNLQRMDAGNYNFVVSANISVGIGSFEIIVQCELTLAQKPLYFDYAIFGSIGAPQYHSVDSVTPLGGLGLVTKLC